MIQWKDAGLFKVGVLIQERGTWGDVRTYFSNLAFFISMDVDWYPSQSWGQQDPDS